MDTCDIAIIGAGIAGASLAHRLSTGPASPPAVVLLESESQPGMHSTGRSAAMFMESYGPPAARALTRAGRAFYTQPPAGFAEAPLLSKRGALYVATHGQEVLLQERRAKLLATGTAIEDLDAAATVALAPCLRAETVHGALFERDAHDLDVHALHQGYLRGFRGAGGRLHTGARLQRAERSAATWTLHVADGTVLQARTIVNAAGAWADEVAALCGAAPVGLEPRRRSAFTFRAPEGVDASAWPAVVGIDESYYFKPDAGQLLGSPANADPTTPHDVQPEELDIATGIHHIETATTLSIRRPTATWAGLRTFARDGELVLGWDGVCEGFFWLAGQGGYGIQSAAGAAALAAALLLDVEMEDTLRAQGVDPAAMAPGRLR